MLVYQGIALGSLTVGPMLKHVSPRRATQASLILNTGATFAFGGAQSATMLLIFRWIGFLQAVPAVYFPVWVDEFAPADSSTLWMAVIEAGARRSASVLGYVFCGAVTVGLNSAETECLETDLFCGWRIPFYAQSCVLVCFSIASFFLPKELYDLGHDKLGNVMPPALDAMDEESAMPPDGAIPPAVDPSLNETSSTKLRNTELRGSTVPELPTINLSPDPSAARSATAPEHGMTPGGRASRVLGRARTFSTRAHHRQLVVVLAAVARGARRLRLGERLVGVPDAQLLLLRLHPVRRHVHRQRHRPAALALALRQRPVRHPVVHRPRTRRAAGRASRPPRFSSAARPTTRRSRGSRRTPPRGRPRRRRGRRRTAAATAT